MNMVDNDKSKSSTYLKSYFKGSNLRSSLIEKELMHETIFSLTGASGRLIHYTASLDAFTPALNLVLSASIQSKILRICECGWLHNRIRNFIDNVRGDLTSGRVSKALALALDEYLNDYYRLVATLESKLNMDPKISNLQPGETLTQHSQQQEQHISDKKANDCTLEGSNINSDHTLTLTRLILYLREPKQRLEYLAALCDACSNKKGGALASVVYKFTQSGNVGIHSCLRNLLIGITYTLYESIIMWIYDGKLVDPNHEFFIAVNPLINDDRLWYDKYTMRKSMIPNFIEFEQAKKILLIGKSVNFIKHICDEKPNLTEEGIVRKTRLKTVEAIFDQEFSHSFAVMISTVHLSVSRYLLQILFSRYHFLDHLRATRKFLLLGQGDFIQNLMDLLESELIQPASTIQRHHLRGLLESAIRSTNAQYEEPEILQRLDVQLLEFSSNDTGWDVFSLEYIVDGPLSTIFSPDCRLSYLKAFNFLWRAKRMEFTLSSIWRDQLTLARLPFNLQADLFPVFHIIQLLGAEIRHFIQQLHYYVNFEALECAWEVLVKKINNATDLDDVIAAHHIFMSNVVSRCLLDAESRQMMCQLRAIFDLIINFKQLNEDLIAITLNESETRMRFQREIDSTVKLGKWGISTIPEKTESFRRRSFVENLINPVVARLRVLASSYRDMVTEFLNMLQAHRDTSLRFLSHNLNFNCHYLMTCDDEIDK